METIRIMCRIKTSKAHCIGSAESYEYLGLYFFSAVIGNSLGLVFPEGLVGLASFFTQKLWLDKQQEKTVCQFAINGIRTKLSQT